MPKKVQNKGVNPELIAEYQKIIAANPGMDPGAAMTQAYNNLMGIYNGGNQAPNDNDGFPMGDGNEQNKVAENQPVNPFADFNDELNNPYRAAAEGNANNGNDIIPPNGEGPANQENKITKEDYLKSIEGISIPLQEINKIFSGVYNIRDDAELQTRIAEQIAKIEEAVGNNPEAKNLDSFKDPNWVQNFANDYNNNGPNAAVNFMDKVNADISKESAKYGPIPNVNPVNEGRRPEQANDAPQQNDGGNAGGDNEVEANVQQFKVTGKASPTINQLCIDIKKGYAEYEKAKTDLDRNLQALFLESQFEELKIAIDTSPKIKNRLKDGWEKRVEKGLKNGDPAALNRLAEQFINVYKIKEEPVAAQPQAQERKKGAQKKDDPNKGEPKEQVDIDKMLEELEAEKKSIAEERKQLDIERKEFEKQQKALRDAPRKLDTKKMTKEEKKARAIAKAEAKKKEEIRRKNRKRGFYDKDFLYKNESVDRDLVSSQGREIKKLKYLSREITKKGRSSDSYRQILHDLEKLDKFMDEIKGKTNLTADEWERYDKLTLKVYKSTRDYQERKEAQLNERYKDKDYQRDEVTGRRYTVDKDGLKTPLESDYEFTRMKGVDKIHDDIQKLRESMFQKHMDAKAKEMQEKFNKELEKAEDARYDMAENGSISSETMADNVAHSIFYANRVDDLKRQNEFKLKPGESLDGALRRLDLSTRPSEKDLENTKKTTVAKNLTNKGMELLKTGEALTNDSISEEKQNAIQNAGKRRRAPVKKQQPKNEAELGKKPGGPAL